MTRPADPASAAPTAESPGGPLLPARQRHARTSTGTFNNRITETRRRIFLQALAETGSFAEAARIASPRARHPLGPASSFRQLAQRDPEFAEQVAAAEELATASLEAEAMRRARDGYVRPVFQGGRRVGEERVYSDHLLIKLLECRDPSRYNPKRALELSGHLHTAVAGFVIRPEHLLLLDEGMRDALERILEVIVAHEEPALIEHQP